MVNGCIAYGIDLTVAQLEQLLTDALDGFTLKDLLETEDIEYYCSDDEEDIDDEDDYDDVLYDYFKTCFTQTPKQCDKCGVQILDTWTHWKDGVEQEYCRKCTREALPRTIDEVLQKYRDEPNEVFPVDYEKLQHVDNDLQNFGVHLLHNGACCAVGTDGDKSKQFFIGWRSDGIRSSAGSYRVQEMFGPQEISAVDAFCKRYGVGTPGWFVMADDCNCCT